MRLRARTCTLTVHTLAYTDEPRKKHKTLLEKREVPYKYSRNVTFVHQFHTVQFDTEPPTYSIPLVYIKPLLYTNKPLYYKTIRLLVLPLGVNLHGDI